MNAKSKKTLKAAAIAAVLVGMLTGCTATLAPPVITPLAQGSPNTVVAPPTVD